MDKEKEIKFFKQLLNETDYQAIKFAEGHLTEEEYAPIKEQRQTWRNRINELENPESIENPESLENNDGDVEV